VLTSQISDFPNLAHLMFAGFTNSQSEGTDSYLRAAATTPNGSTNRASATAGGSATRNR
jgi:hypothetical protein